MLGQQLRPSSGIVSSQPELFKVLPGSVYAASQQAISLCAQAAPAAAASGSSPLEGSKGDASPGGSTLHSIFGKLLRTQSGHLLRSNSASQTPTCLICLESLAPEDFEVKHCCELCRDLCLTGSRMRHVGQHMLADA